MRKVEVRPYDPRWQALFAAEAELLRQVFQDNLIQIHHIGSTVVRDIGRVDETNEQMRSLGYLPKGEFGLPGRRYFAKGGDERTHHVHVYEQGHPAIRRHLAFRDYLRAHPDCARLYGELKEQLAERFPYDAASYVAGKHELACSLEQKALAWKARGAN
ncbi:GrpB family protein [Brevibacillus agri]|uniref:GrpB family protein n=1 Tax=Brevibacillus agri TaxID=51101 RepID=UPI00046FA25F|nr:GrpB family protein [Brevibacillus agri]